jgi:hypothetical protein
MVQEYVSDTSARFRWEEEVLEETKLCIMTVGSTLLTIYSSRTTFR